MVKEQYFYSRHRENMHVFTLQIKGVPVIASQTKQSLLDGIAALRSQ